MWIGNMGGNVKNNDITGRELKGNKFSEEEEKVFHKGIKVTTGSPGVGDPCLWHEKMEEEVRGQMQAEDSRTRLSH